VKVSLRKGQNPDAALLLGFFFDLLAGMCGNILFAVCTDVRSVLGIIAVEAAENVVMTVMAGQHFMAYNVKADDVELNRGITLMLSMVMSEWSEMMGAFWAELIYAGLYYGANKNYIGGIRGEIYLAGFRKTIYFSTIDLGTQLVVSSLLLVFLKLHANVRALKVLQSYLEETNSGFVGAFAAEVVVPILAMSFFLEHAGMDASFTFKWLDAGTALNLVGGFP
jgi:hypothetical protein